MAFQWSWFSNTKIFRNYFIVGGQCILEKTFFQKLFCCLDILLKYVGKYILTFSALFSARVEKYFSFLKVELVTTHGWTDQFGHTKSIGLPDPTTSTNIPDQVSKSAQINQLAWTRIERGLLIELMAYKWMEKINFCTIPKEIIFLKKCVLQKENLSLIMISIAPTIEQSRKYFSKNYLLTNWPFVNFVFFLVTLLLVQLFMDL